MLDDTDDLNEYNVFVIQQKAMYLTAALKNALEYMPTLTWTDCCKKAIDQCSQFGLTYLKNGETIRRWHKAFRENGNKLRNPGRISSSKVILPPLLENNPEVVRAINEFFSSFYSST